MQSTAKTGKVNFEDYEDESYLSRLDPVVERLQEDCPEAKFDRKSLALFVAHLLQFMEDALGEKALPPRPCPKVPAKVLQDFSPTGAVYAIAKKCEEIRRNRNLKKVDFANPARRKENLDILLQLRYDLKRDGHLRDPRIHLHSSCQDRSAELHRLATQLGAEIAPSPDAPGVTHIVYSFGPNGDPDDGLQYMRKLSSRGQDALVHWWYWPDSYDGYIPADTAPEDAEPDKRVRGAWGW